MLTNMNGYDKSFEVPCRDYMSKAIKEGPCNRNEFFEFDKHHSSEVDPPVLDHCKLHKHLHERTVKAKDKSQSYIMQKLEAKCG